MDPISIGSAIALLAGKKLIEKVGSEAGEAGWGLANKMIGKVRGLFGASENVEALAKLEEVEGSEIASSDDVDELAALIAEELQEAGKVTASLAPLVEQAKSDPELAESLASAGDIQARASVIVNQSVTGDGNIVVGTAGGDVNVNQDPKS